MAGDFVRARRALAKVGSGLGAEVHGLFLDCLQYQKVNETALSRILQQQDGLVDGHATSSAQSLVREVLGGGCYASNESLHTLLDHLLASRTRSVIDKQSVMFTKARLLESTEQIDAAVEILLAAQKLSDSDALPLYLAARTLVYSGRPDEAHAMLMRASEMEKNTRIRRLDIAQATFLAVGKNHALQGQSRKALAVYTDAISAMPRQSLFYFEKAELLLRMQQYDEAGKLLASIRELELADIDQYDYSLLRIEARLQQHLDETSDSGS
jgi:tetratricopeptide (TPR) repeat protein